MGAKARWSHPWAPRSCPVPLGPPGSAVSPWVCCCFSEMLLFQRTAVSGDNFVKRASPLVRER